MHALTAAAIVSGLPDIESGSTGVPAIVQPADASAIQSAAAVPAVIRASCRPVIAIRQTATAVPESQEVVGKWNSAHDVAAVHSVATLKLCSPTHGATAPNSGPERPCADLERAVSGS